MKTKVNKQQGFTLIELLVVIAIIAILASVSVPALQRAQVSGKMNKSMQEAVGIAKALKIYSDDESGLFPTAEDSNTAFAELFPEYMTKESPFFVAGSAWHGRGDFRDGPDNLFGSEDDNGAGEALEAGENHWAYNTLTADDSGATIPMIADGFGSAVGTYATEKSEIGGVWKGKKAIVVFCDYSGSVVKLNDQQKFVNEKANDQDQFTRNGVDMVNPKQP